MTTGPILRELAARLTIAANNLEPARRRLHEQQPGFPPTASGANPGTTPTELADNDRGPSTIVERLALQKDAARTALDDINRITHDLTKRSHDITRLYSLTLTWAPPATTPVRTPQDDDHQWCTNHLNGIGTCEPRARGTLCRWCDDFQRSQGWQPNRALLRARADNKRITERMIADAKPPPATTPKPGKRRKGKR